MRKDMEGKEENKKGDTSRKSRSTKGGEEEEENKQEVEYGDLRKTCNPQHSIQVVFSFTKRP